MEVYYNELSHKPIVNTSDEARQRILTLLSTMQSLRELNFTFLRIHNNFYESPIGIGYMVVDFLSDPNVARWQKTLLQTIARNPFIPNEDSPEAEMFLMHGFQTLDHEGTLVSPEGMAAAYVHGRPTLSISSHAFWQKSPLVLNVTANPSFASQEEVMNFWSTDSVEAWKSSLPAEKVVEIPLDSKENIKARFPESTYHFEERAMNDMIFWFANDERYQRRIVMLIRNISTNPFTGGIGKTETLGGQGGMASKRIGEKDRLVYTYTEEKITIHSCRGHYDDH